MTSQSLFKFSYGIAVSPEMKKVKILTRTHKTGAQEESKGVWIGVMQEGKYTLGLHVI